MLILLNSVFLGALAVTGLALTAWAEPADGDVGQAKVIVFQSTGSPNCNWVVNKGDDDHTTINCVGGSGTLAFVGTDPRKSGFAYVSTASFKPNSDADDDSDRGWLGVNIGEVSPAMAAQLGLDGEGVMITNVVKDSPAQDAGLKRYDIVTAIDGQILDSSIASLSQIIAEAGESATIKLTVLRGGKEQTLRAKLGSRPTDAIEWQHDFSFGPSIRERFHTRGKVLRFGPHGDAFFTDLGDLKALKDLPDNIKAFLPHIDDVMTNVWVDAQDGHINVHIKTRVEQDGEIIEIEQQGDEQITVRRESLDDQGNTQTTVNTYESAEALEEADPDAFEIFSGIQGPHFMKLELDDLHDGFKALHLQLDDLKDFDFDGDFQFIIKDSLDKAHDAYSHAMKFGPKFKAFKFGMPGAFFIGGPSYKFNVDSDGGITATFRKGDSEVTLNFDDEDDLRRSNPDLYEKFVGVTEDEED